jgi:ankyrin repeat protein
MVTTTTTQASPNVRNRAGLTAMHLACEANRDSLALFLLETAAGTPRQPRPLVQIQYCRARPVLLRSSLATLNPCSCALPPSPPNSGNVYARDNSGATAVEKANPALQQRLRYGSQRLCVDTAVPFAMPKLD